MVRPRTLLLSYFPQSSVITQEIASQALRDTEGDVERAREFLEKLVQQQEPTTMTVVTKVETKCENKPKVDDINNSRVIKSKQAKTDPATDENLKHDQNERRPPNSVAMINNLSDRQYCCVWSVEVYEDGYRPEVARTLLAQIAHHVNPILRARGWRVKRLMESASSTFIGCCTGNGRNDADAASTNIQLNLRVQPNKHCTVFRTFSQLLSVMLHEITHTSIGLEDIHPPAFYELMNEIKKEYREKLALGEVDLETDLYGCDAKVVTRNGNVMTVAEAAADIVPTFMTKTVTTVTPTDNILADDECGVKRFRRRRRKGSTGYRKRTSMNNNTRTQTTKPPPLRKGAKMIDKRTVTGKRILTESVTLSRRELAARAAIARFSTTASASTKIEHIVAATPEENRFDENNNSADAICSDDSSNENEDEYSIQSHQRTCTCRSCDWDRLLFMPMTNSSI